MTPTPRRPINLLDLDRAGLAQLFEALGEPPARAQRRALSALRAVHGHFINDIMCFEGINRALKQRLAEAACVAEPAFATTSVSSDGTTRWTVAVSGDQLVETVFIPEARRGTLCISSQVGCALECTFCSTARQGFNRNLSAGEIIGQVRLAARALAPSGRRITNVVLMGMGEPLLNLEAVISATSVMMDDFAYGLSSRRVTVSTSGVVPAMARLKARSPVALAVSLHAPTDALRDRLVPLNRKYPLAALMPACRDYFSTRSRRVVTFEYVMLDGVNDQPEHADQLAALLGEMPGKVNLIPWNPFPGAPWRRSPASAVRAFQARLIERGRHTITRKTRGDDIDAACGQLVGEVQDRTRRAARHGLTEAR